MGDNLATTVTAAAQGGAATLLGFLAVALAWVALPAAERRRLRLPVLFLILHLAALGVEHLVPANARRPWEFFGLLFVWAALAQSLPMLVIDGLLAHRLRWLLPKIFRDIIQMLVYFGVGLVVLHSIGVEPSSLLATSALLTAVIGLSLQDTLGNLFAGLAIQAQTPFEVGDWVQLADSNEPLGRVVEINWRATKLLTTDRVEIVVPNANLARTPIRNFSKPTVLLRRQIRVMVPSDFAPAHVRNLLEAAVDGTPGVLPEPKPNVIVGDFDPDGLLYVLRYFTNDAEHVHPVDGRVRERIWHALRRAGVPFARDVREVFQHTVHAEDAEHSRLSKLAERRATLRQVEVFEVLPDASIDVLAGLVHTRRFAAGEYVLRKGDAGGEMYVVEHGEVAVVVEQAGGQATEVARLGQGKFFGEMSLMTGAPRTATVRAATDLALLVVDKAAFQEVLQQSPDVAVRMSEMLVLRQGELERESAKSTGQHVPPAERNNAMLSKIRDFFAI